MTATELENEHQSLSAWRSSGLTFRHQELNIFFRDEGSGPSLLLIHGYPTNSFDWHRLWPSLSRNYRLIALDLTGLGFSDKPLNHAYSVMDHAQLVEALLDHLGITELHIAAHDMGVGILQEMLAKRLEDRTLPHIISAVFMNGCLFPEVYRPRLIQRLLKSPLGPLIGPRVPEKAFVKAMRPTFGPHTQPTSEQLDSQWQIVIHGDGRKVTHLLNRAIFDRAIYRDRFVSAMQKTTTPLRLINGSADPNSGLHMAQRYRELIPRSDIIELHGIGHWPQLEAPDAVLHAMQNFFQQRRDAES